ncbi:hypothetical protein O6H91_01G120500 [Diphasiastrum complanatum]|nr:hypothetical protein O6H91_01G120500 [Diphasiastrum complanatum]
MLIAIQSRFGIVRARFGLDSAFSQSHLDPLAVNDTFVTLSPALKNLLLRPSNFDADQMRDHLHSLQSTTLVTVKLVGFSSSDRSQLESQFSRLLEAFNQHEHVSIIGANPHKLMIRSRIDLQVTRASPQLADTIFQAIENHLAMKTSTNPRFNLEAVPHTLVDEIIQADLEKPLSSYVIYLLSPKHQRVSYGYQYSKEPDRHIYTCQGSSWAGRDRYMWVDLAAGPVEYGPSLSGEGLVVKAETHPLAALHTGSPARSSFLADLASVVWSAAQMLLLPPLRIPVYFDKEVEVNFIHIGHGGDDDNSQIVDINWSAIESAFLEENGNSFTFASQSVRFKRYSINVQKCAVCAAVLARSTKSFASRILMERYSLFMSEYIDSKQLYYLLTQNQKEIADLAGIDSYGLFRTVPVYVFDLPKERNLLLDRLHQAIAFKDSVIAIRTVGSYMIGDFHCNGRPITRRARDLERPIVGALLQTIWGVSPTHLTWSFQHNASLVDYTWSVGQTPFGPFSDLFTLSFVQRDAAPRSVLYTMLNLSIWSATDVVTSVEDQGGDKKLLSRKEHVQFMQRWNLCLFKLNKALSSITHFDFNSALYFIKSADHDLAALHYLVFEATSSSQASIVCFKDPPFPWHWILASLCLVAIAIYLWIRRERLFVNKKKKF